MSSLYYLGVGVCSLAISIYNFNVHSTDIVCLQEQLMSQEQYFNLTSKNATADKNDPDLFTVETTNIFGILALIIAIVFIILFIMSIFLSCVINSMSNQLPEDFLNIGAIKKFMACFCKIFPPIFIILSWLNFILIIVIWILVLTDTCLKSEKKIEAVDENKYYNDVKVLNLVNSIIWFVLHYGGAIIRDMTYQEPFMYSPDTGKPNCLRTLVLKKLGP